MLMQKCIIDDMESKNTTQTKGNEIMTNSAATNDSKAIIWKRTPSGDYTSACGTFVINKLEAWENEYANRDEWILGFYEFEYSMIAVDVYPLLRDAKAEAQTIANQNN